MPNRPSSVNLYHFIRLVLGPGVSDREIARRWKIDHKNFLSLKHGRLPVPKIERLERLSEILNISPYFIWLVCTGMSADWVYSLASEGEPIEGVSRSASFFNESGISSPILFELLIQQIPMAIFGFNRDCETLFWNRGCEKIYEREPSEVLGKFFYRFTAEESGYGKVKEIVEHVFSKKMTMCLEQEWVNPSGARHYLFNSFYPLMNETGEVLMGVSANFDLEKLKAKNDSRR